MNATVAPPVPEAGQIVEVRGSTWAVANVRSQGLPRSPADEAIAQLTHVVELRSLDACSLDDRDAFDVVWAGDVVRHFEHVDVAVAVATEHGLVTPVVRGVDRLTITELAATIQDLVVRAQEKRLQQSELEGGTVSVSNLGMYGTEEFSAIINPPQSSILAVGAARPEPVVVDGALGVATVLHVTLSVDHRPVDGATAARWMQAFVELLEHPARILA